MPGALYCSGNAALKLERITGDPSGQNFSLLVHKLLQEFRVFIIDIPDSITTKAAILGVFLPNLRIAQKLNIIT